MAPVPPRVYHVECRMFGDSYQFDTPDPAKIGPWLCDLVSLIRLHPQLHMPVDLQVRIT
jgi:hypothetical protein